MNEPLLALRSVGKVYDRGGAAVTALADVHVTIGAGEYVAVIGPSGSGKSTLMHLIGCLDRPSHGSCRFAGTEVAQATPDEAARVRRGIGFVFQSFHLLPRATALENVALPLRYAGVPLAERSERAARMLARVGLAERRDHLPSELSGGQQQRVAIARALVAEPPLLLADEPTGSLDSRSGQDVTELLEELWREGRTLIVVTHDERLAARARRTIRLLDGRIVADG